VELYGYGPRSRTIQYLISQLDLLIRGGIYEESTLSRLWCDDHQIIDGCNLARLGNELLILKKKIRQLVEE